MTDVPRLTPDEIIVLARGVVTNTVFFAHTPERMTGFETFLRLAADKLPPVNQIGAVYENMSAAGPLSINGWPMFLSCKFLHVDDLEAFGTEYERMAAALGIGDD